MSCHVYVKLETSVGGWQCHLDLIGGWSYRFLPWQQSEQKIIEVLAVQSLIIFCSHEFLESLLEASSCASVCQAGTLPPDWKFIIQVCAMLIIINVI